MPSKGRAQAARRQGVHLVPDRTGPGAQVRPFQAGGFTETERQAASEALLALFRTEAQAVRTLILTFQHFEEVREAVRRAVPALPAVMGRVTVRPGIRDVVAHVAAQRPAASNGATMRSR